MGQAGDMRRERFSQLVSFPPGPALEIGPLAEPILLRTDHDVRYVDVFDQNGLRDHYRNDDLVDCSAIPPIDFTLSSPTGFQTLAEAVREGAPYGYLVASHVIEHVPDVIGWLADAADVLRDDGLLLLVVPDKRYCFDFYRQQTSVGQMLQAAQSRDRTPSVRAVYDHFRDASTISAGHIWCGIPPGDIDTVRMFDIDAAQEQARRAEAGEYVDSHVWTFTPSSFTQQFGDLGALGECEFEIEGLTPTPENHLEFYVAFRRLPRSLDSSIRRERIRVSIEAAQVALQAAPQPPDEEAAELQALTADLEVLTAKLHQAQEEVARLRTEVTALKASERWRLGGLLVGPPRWIMDRARALSDTHDRA